MSKELTIKEKLQIKIKNRKDCYLYDLDEVSFEKAYQEVIFRLNILLTWEGDKID